MAMEKRKYRVSVLLDTSGGNLDWVQFVDRAVSIELANRARTDEKLQEQIASNVGMSVKQSGFISGMSAHPLTQVNGQWLLIPAGRIVKYLIQIIHPEEKKEGQV